MTTRSELNELLNITKGLILEEYKEQDALFVDQEHYDFFLNLPKLKSEERPKTLVPRVEQKMPAPTIKAKIETPEPLAPVEKALKEEISQEKWISHLQSQETRNSTESAFLEIQALIKEKAPHIKIISEIPSDQVAKAKASSWKLDLPEVLIIADSPDEIPFLDKIAAAIEGLGVHAKTLEKIPPKEKIIQAPHIRLILAPKSIIDAYASLTCTMIALLPVKDYIAIPKEKAALWQMIRETLK